MDEKAKKVTEVREADIHEIVDYSFSAGDEWATFAAVYNRYKEGAKQELASIKNKVRKTQSPPNGKKSWTRDDLEEAAYAHQDWSTYLSTMNEAYEGMLKTKVNYDGWRARFEAARSVMATERSAGKMS